MFYRQMKLQQCGRRLEERSVDTCVKSFSWPNSCLIFSVMQNESFNFFFNHVDVMTLNKSHVVVCLVCIITINLLFVNWNSTQTKSAFNNCHITRLKSNTLEATRLHAIKGVVTRYGLLSCERSPNLIRL